MSTKVEELAGKLLESLETSGTLGEFISQYHEHFHPLGRVVWTGFKPEQASMRVVGQWLFWPPDGYKDGPFYYASLPTGGEGPYLRGEHFDVGSSLGAGPFPTREALKASMLDGLVRLITMVLEDEPPWIKSILDEGEKRMVRAD